MASIVTTVSASGLHCGISTRAKPGGRSTNSVSYSLSSPKARRTSVVVRAEAGTINPEIRKSEPKVVDTVVASELAKPLTPYCRCWRSATFPLCDGSHVKHNKETGDNVGPLLLKK